MVYLLCFPLPFLLSNDVSFLPNSSFLGFHFNSIPKPASLSQAPMYSAPPSFVPFRPSGPPLLGGCETPVVSLAEAQQELQMLQKQLGESEHCSASVCLRVAAHALWLCMALACWWRRGKLGTHPRWQMEGKLACFLSEMHLLLSLRCAPSATGGIQIQPHRLLTDLGTALCQCASLAVWEMLIGRWDEDVMLCPCRVT